MSLTGAADHVCTAAEPLRWAHVQQVRHFDLASSSAWSFRAAAPLSLPSYRMERHLSRYSIHKPVPMELMKVLSHHAPHGHTAPRQNGCSSIIWSVLRQLSPCHFIFFYLFIEVFLSAAASNHDKWNSKKMKPHKNKHRHEGKWTKGNLQEQTGRLNAQHSKIKVQWRSNPKNRTEQNMDQIQTQVKSQESSSGRSKHRKHIGRK